VGVFPENAMQWEWMSGVLRKLPAGRRILNLFGYTGIASLVAAACGAEVVHVDSSRRALRMGQANQSLSDLVNAKVRWLQDDALKFVEREARRGHTYHGLLLDPPLYGKGPRNETWQFEREIGRLCRLCRDLLEPEGAFVVMTAYGLNRSPAYLAQFLEVLLRGAAGKAAYGELRIPHETSRRRLSLAISARWVSEA
jgi:23S rRNA (cytosine1962-C5)-methyltransferase